MFKTILYPTDFSDVASSALEFVKQLKEAGAKEVIVLHVIDIRGIDALSRYASRDLIEIENVMEEEIEKKVDQLEQELTDCGLTVKVRIERGVPFREILRVEEEEDVSLIVLGSHGVSNIEEMFLGSVSEKVIRKAKSPVLVVKR
jgi:nucleotide-binding universal stress UspA family protein